MSEKIHFFSCPEENSDQKLSSWINKKVCSVVHPQTDRHIEIDAAMKTEDTLSGFHEFFFNLSSAIGPISYIKVYPNVYGTYVMRYRRDQRYYSDVFSCFSQTETSSRSSLHDSALLIYVYCAFEMLTSTYRNRITNMM